VFSPATPLCDQIYEYPWRKTSSKQVGDGSSAGRRRLLYDVLVSCMPSPDIGCGFPLAAQSESLFPPLLQTPGRNRRIPPVPMRPATSQEPAPYLAAPSFSNCTVPILLYSSWRSNFFHIFKGGGAAPGVTTLPGLTWAC
jgi:hypothetical protein